MASSSVWVFPPKSQNWMCTNNNCIWRLHGEIWGEEDPRHEGTPLSTAPCHLHPLQTILGEYMHSQMTFHAKALELYTIAYQNLHSISEQEETEVSHPSWLPRGNKLLTLRHVGIPAGTPPSEEKIKYNCSWRLTAPQNYIRSFTVRLHAQIWVVLALPYYNSSLITH